MRTTLDLDERLLAQAQEATGERTKTAVIEHALRVVIQRAAARRLAALGGTIPNAKAAPRRRTPARAR